MDDGYAVLGSLKVETTDPLGYICHPEKSFGFEGFVVNKWDPEVFFDHVFLIVFVFARKPHPSIGWRVTRIS